jgi:PKD repeat protein
MMKPRHLYILLLFLAVALSCTKRKYPDSIVENEVVYGFKALIGNEEISFEAGKDNYYMYSSYKQDSNKVYNFTGTLKQIDCSDCRKSLEIQINDFKVSELNAPVKTDSAFSTRSYPLLNGTTTYVIPFQSSYNRNAASYSWDFGDGTTSAVANPVHQFSKSGNYKVKLKIISDNGCESYIEHVERVGITSSNNLRAYINVASANSATVNFGAMVTGGKAPYAYSWSFGDGTASTSTNPTRVYKLNGGYSVMLKVTDADNQVTVTSYNLVTPNDVSSCAANFTGGTITTINNTEVSLALSKIIVTWIDGNGVKYTSNNELQPFTSNFAITSVEEAGLNENSQPTKKLHLKFDCTVYNGTKALPIKGAEATVSVAYKKD